MSAQQTIFQPFPARFFPSDTASPTRPKAQTWPQTTTVTHFNVKFQTYCHFITTICDETVTKHTNPENGWRHQGHIAGNVSFPEGTLHQIAMDRQLPYDRSNLVNEVSLKVSCLLHCFWEAIRVWKENGLGVCRTSARNSDSAEYLSTRQILGLGHIMHPSI